jgi:hypothetical protein
VEASATLADPDKGRTPRREEEMTEGRTEMTPVQVRRIRFGLLALIVVAAIVFLLVKVIGGDDSSSSDEGAPVGLSESELIDKAPSFSHVAYWVGPQEGTDQYELTETPDGRIYVRYLTEGADVGNDSPDFVTVGTYAFPDAKKGLGVARSAGQLKSIDEGDGYSVADGTSGQNVYVVFDDQPDLQVEVFSPEPGKARDLVDSGALEPIG